MIGAFLSYQCYGQEILMIASKVGATRQARPPAAKCFGLILMMYVFSYRSTKLYKYTPIKASKSSAIPNSCGRGLYGFQCCFVNFCKCALANTNTLRAAATSALYAAIICVFFCVCVSVLSVISQLILLRQLAETLKKNVWQLCFDIIV